MNITRKVWQKSRKRKKTILLNSSINNYNIYKLLLYLLAVRHQQLSALIEYTTTAWSCRPIESILITVPPLGRKYELFESSFTCTVCTITSTSVESSVLFSVQTVVQYCCTCCNTNITRSVRRFEVLPAFCAFFCLFLLSRAIGVV